MRFEEIQIRMSNMGTTAHDRLNTAAPGALPASWLFAFRSGMIQMLKVTQISGKIQL